MADEKSPPTANPNTNKGVDKLIKIPEFGTMKNTSGTTTVEPKSKGK